MLGLAFNVASWNAIVGATRLLSEPSSRLPPVTEIANRQPSEPTWETGDVVLDAVADIYQRADEQSVEEGWPWHLGVQSAYDLRHNVPAAPEGGHSEDAPIRPLTLLVRRGKAVQTISMTSESVSRPELRR